MCMCVCVCAIARVIDLKFFKENSHTLFVSPSAR